MCVTVQIRKGAITPIQIVHHNCHKALNSRMMLLSEISVIYWMQICDRLGHSICGFQHMLEVYSTFHNHDLLKTGFTDTICIIDIIFMSKWEILHHDSD